MVVFVLGAITASECVPTCYPARRSGRSLFTACLAAIMAVRYRWADVSYQVPGHEAAMMCGSLRQSGETMHDESTVDERAELM